MNDLFKSGQAITRSSRRSFLTGLAATALMGAASGSVLAAGDTPKNSSLTGTSNGRNISPGKSPLTRLNNGVDMPVFGVGTFALPTIQTADVINFALNNGYRLIDTAKNYGNEKEVGEGIVRSGVDRSELFVTTKLWIEDYGYDEAMRAFDRSLNQLGLEYVDLYLLHWPVPTDFSRTVSAYKALEKLYAEKRIRAIGVSNFQPEHLKMLTDQTEVVPVLNQIELHPYMSQRSVCEANDSYGIKTESWSPIGGVFTTLPKDPSHPVRVLEDPVILGLARKHKKTAAQIVARWHIQQGRILMPKSQHYERLLANIEIFDFEISNEDMRSVDALNRDLRGGPDPQSFDVAAFQEIAAKRRAAL
ncbi:TPA: aldo/keto reductase [Salmonella enterica]